jgi:hypothetical protein
MSQSTLFRVGDVVYIAGDFSSDEWTVIGLTRGGEVLCKSNGDTRKFLPAELSIEPYELPHFKPGDLVEVRWTIDERYEWRPARVLSVILFNPEYDSWARVLVEYEEWKEAESGTLMQMRHRVGKGIRYRNHPNQNGSKINSI